MNGIFVIYDDDNESNDSCGCLSPVPVPVSIWSTRYAAESEINRRITREGAAREALTVRFVKMGAKL